VVETDAGMSAREEILRRIAAAGSARGEGTEPSSYRRVGTLDAQERAALFCERVGDYRADVRRIEEAQIADSIAAACATRSARRIVIPKGVPPAWRSSSVELVEDDGLSARALDELDGVITACTVAIAESGTIVLAGGSREGRRALSLVPDLHLCVVGERQIVELLPEAVARLEDGGLTRRPLTFISGPSATSDIELSRVEGVHGPRDLVVLVVKETT
jgi:L-lactate dehydrogenase complex protein LldG